MLFRSVEPDWAVLGRLGESGSVLSPLWRRRWSSWSVLSEAELSNDADAWCACPWACLGGRPPRLNENGERAEVDCEGECGARGVGGIARFRSGGTQKSSRYALKVNFAPVDCASSTLHHHLVQRARRPPTTA
mgnify:CR=1 FL=1